METARERQLLDQIAELKRENHSLREEAVRHHNRADEERRSWIRTHDAMNLLREDAMAVLRNNNAASVYSDLEQERYAHQKLKDRRQHWMRFARQSVEMKALLTQKLRDAHAALEEMRQQAERTEQEKKDVAETAQKVIDARDAQLARIADQCRLWKRGELDTMTTIAGICGDVNGHPLPEPGTWERRKSALHAELMSQHRLMTEELAQIEALMNVEGIDLDTTYAAMIKKYIERVDARNKP